LGIAPAFRDFRKIILVVKIGAISFESSLSNLGFNASGPAALEGFKFNSSRACYGYIEHFREFRIS